jgi:hypothetical protein
VSVAFSIPPWRSVHDFNVSTRNGRRLVIDIYRDNQDHYETTVTVYEIGSVPGRVFLIDSSPKPPEEHFKSALEWIHQKYLKQVDPSDAVTDIHNPCNCPFVSQADQARIATSLGITAPIRVN